MSVLVAVNTGFEVRPGCALGRSGLSESSTRDACAPRGSQRKLPAIGKRIDGCTLGEGKLPATTRLLSRCQVGIGRRTSS